MAIYPGAVFKPTPHGGRVKRNRQGRGILHVAVSDRRSYPPDSANTWHFYVAHDGYCEQYVDTDFCAATSSAANDDAIGIETAGGTGSSAVLNAERWTPAAAERLADIMAWESKQPGGAPLELLPDARPGRRGWGPHRLGIKHSGGPRPGWWQPGSESWSSVLGKECPGNAKVAQIPELIARARQIVGGAPATPEDDMPLSEEDLVKINQYVWMRTPPGLDSPWPGHMLKGIDGNVGFTAAGVSRLLAQGGQDAQAVAAAIRPLLLDAVREGMAADNDATADEIVDQLAARLGTTR